MIILKCLKKNSPNQILQLTKEQQAIMLSSQSTIEYFKINQVHFFPRLHHRIITAIIIALHINIRNTFLAIHSFFCHHNIIVLGMLENYETCQNTKINWISVTIGNLKRDQQVRSRNVSVNFQKQKKSSFLFKTNWNMRREMYAISSHGPFELCPTWSRLFGVCIKTP